MTAKKWMAIAMIFALLLTGMVGCKSADTEEGAVVDEYVESDTPATEVEQDLPEKVEQSGNTGSSTDDGGDEPSQQPADNNDNSNDTPNNDTPADDTPNTDTQTPTEDTNTPSDDTPEEEPTVQYKEGNKLKVMSYNVRCANDGTGRMIAERGPRLEIVVDMYDPDIVGFQEVTPTWRTMLEGYFSDEYDYVYQERSPGGECTPIFWKKDKFEKKDGGHFWLSETPDTSSIGFGGDHYRVVSWVRLKNKATGTQFLYFNTHYDFTATQHIPSGQLILARARKAGGFSKYGVLLTADFNMTPWSKGYQTLVETGDLSDVNYDLENLSDGTCNGYNDGDGSGGSIIDMCFYSPAKIVPLSYKVVNEKVNDGYVSDHRGIFMEVALL
ncbi:MAG: endonuclease/exonuclease/phosphatase family protein [Clostridia bacterium]|nr:endonuclease/exonuclease/phosphatase family protein [Clostridia bacterium]